MGRKTIALLCAVGVCLAVALPLATAGGRVKQAAGTAGCTVAGNQVNAVRLPTDVGLNFFIHGASGWDGWPLGSSADGVWSVTVPDRTGPTTYEFASTTFGKDGAKYWVYASCSAS